MAKFATRKKNSLSHLAINLKDNLFLLSSFFLELLVLEHFLSQSGLWLFGINERWEGERDKLWVREERSPGLLFFFLSFPWETLSSIVYLSHFLFSLLSFPSSSSSTSLSCYSSLNPSDLPVGCDRTWPGFAFCPQPSRLFLPSFSHHFSIFSNDFPSLIILQKESERRKNLKKEELLSSYTWHVCSFSKIYISSPSLSFLSSSLCNRASKVSTSCPVPFFLSPKKI